MSDRRQFLKYRIDESALKVIRETYPQGTQVEAVKVNGVKSGLKGVVREVRTNGDVSVLWCTGDIVSAEYGVDSIKVVGVKRRCTIPSKLRTAECAEESERCDNCGWNESVAAERIKTIRNGGLTRGEDGRYRLILNKVAK